jgi:hypothetical protein
MRIVQQLVYGAPQSVSDERDRELAKSMPTGPIRNLASWIGYEHHHYQSWDECAETQKRRPLAPNPHPRSKHECGISAGVISVAFLLLLLR